jgi:hypothetical protein
MAKIRFGYSDDFTAKNSGVGINTTDPQENLDVDGVVKGQGLKVTGISSQTGYEGFLRADHQIEEETQLNFGQGINASLSGEIIVGTGVTVTIASVGLGTTVVAVGSGTKVNTIDTTDTTRAGGSQIECMKVYNTFTPPSGGINDRPYKPKPGQLYYNYDFKTIEFFDGYGWRQADNTTRSGRMLVGGGTAGGSLKIQSLNINTFGNSEHFGDLTEGQNQAGSFSSATRGIFGGGTYINTIGYVTIPSAGNAIDFGDLSTTNRGYVSGSSSSTRGLWGGGYTSSPSAQTVNVIDYVEIGTLGNALDFGDMFSGRYSAASVSNGVRAVWGGGMGNVPTSNTGTRSLIDYVTIASKGDSIKFGDLSVTRRMLGEGACSNNIRGIFAGGQQPALLTVMDYITIATDGNAVYFGDLTEARARTAASSTSTRGLWAGGLNPNNSNVIDYVNIASTGDALDFGDLYLATGVAASCSDSHGGLGGF